MNHDLILGMLLVQGAMRRSLAPMPEEAPLDPIDFAALRRLSSQPETKPEPREPVEDLRIAA